MDEVKSLGNYCFHKCKTFFQNLTNVMFPDVMRWVKKWFRRNKKVNFKKSLIKYMVQFKRIFFFIFLLASACIEPYDFKIKNESPALVVEGYISDVSYNESLQYPSDGRFFTIKLRLTSDVVNLRDKVAENASVRIESSTGEEWHYTELPYQPGTYVLNDKDFKAFPGVQYKLQILLTDERRFESSWEELPSAGASSVGSIGFQEVEKLVHVYKAEERVLETVKGVDVHIELPEKDSGKTTFYRWDFTPVWIYIAPLANPSQEDYKCWATNRLYLSGYALQEDRTGGYKKPLFFMETVRNERIFDRLSVLVTQYEMSEGFFNFWKEMKEQVEAGGLSDIPPYNLQTNIEATDGAERVSGYFGVVNENARRWYFSKEELSYFVENTLLPDCQVSYGPGPPAPACTSCSGYSRGEATTEKPGWWE